MVNLQLDLHSCIHFDHKLKIKIFKPPQQNKVEGIHKDCLIDMQQTHVSHARLDIVKAHQLQLSSLRYYARLCKQ